MWVAIYDLVILALLVINAEATYSVECGVLSDNIRVENAITEASNMARCKEVIN